MLSGRFAFGQQYFAPGYSRTAETKVPAVACIIKEYYAGRWPRISGLLRRPHAAFS